MLPGLLALIVAGVFLMLLSRSFSSSVAESLGVRSSGCFSSATLVVCTSVRMGPRNGQ